MWALHVLHQRCCGMWTLHMLHQHCCASAQCHTVPGCPCHTVTGQACGTRSICQSAKLRAAGDHVELFWGFGPQADRGTNCLCMTPCCHEDIQGLRRALFCQSAQKESNTVLLCCRTCSGFTPLLLSFSSSSSCCMRPRSQSTQHPQRPS